MSHEEKLAFIDEVFIREGIKLDMDAVVRNSAKRQVAKLLLNSLWGWFYFHLSLILGYVYV